jgi:hypothetical protein
MKTYIEEFLTTFSGFHQMVFSFLTAYSLQQLFPQLTVYNNFFHSHSPTKQTIKRILAPRIDDVDRLSIVPPRRPCTVKPSGLGTRSTVAQISSAAKQTSSASN